MNKALHYYTLAMAAFLTIAIFASYSGKLGEEPEKSEVDNNNIPQVIKAVDLSKPFDFAGESLPMDNFDVAERLDRELLVNTYWHSNTILNIKNAYKYFPVIERILKKNGIPEDFKYLAVAESSLRNEVSPAGARGIWQFMNGTAEQYGLETNREVDERYHLEKSTQAACELLKDYYRRLNSWTLTAAAYNAGLSRISREMEEQRAETYFDLNLNAETSRYVFRLVAIKEILSRPQDFGFYLDTDERYPPLEDYRVVEVDTAIDNLGDFAREQGTSYRMLKVYNPWLMDSKLPNRSGKTYEIKIPQ
ncbi:MAG: lytic transglycosylase domain-containing protein [Lewinellaceae bacterium]|nr:lytic transglycosylase domain-containing protein [Phaeodactylibacter sp.]MCB9039654.1 lytic transglycosylase domain-containing protein [Lewinellaceae bacterium]